MTYAEAVSQMTDEEREIPITKLLKSVGLVHFPHDFTRREVRNEATGEHVGFYSSGEAIILFVETRNAIANAA
ncbi:hypothetical protein [Rhizobium lentis]|uniref:Uncharacterized protein n=1 Tax=Rhizobium lentis TaxID=1138194 RepID=A0ABS7IBW4_9HYPH|nr:hypothetical protein [Rhizobium lentis]MBX5089382.1 hypothetical protein [Rhizobium lentis]